MAVRTAKYLVCDICGIEDGVRHWRVVRDDERKLSPDLCVEHSKCLDDVFAKIPAGAGRRTNRRPVLTDAQVRAQRRKPAKKAAAKP